MNKVLILSDSHGLKEELTQIKARHQVQHLIHCGDSELDMDDPALEGFLKVGGNCDDDARFPIEQTTEIGELTFLIVHGHLHDVKSNLITLSSRAKDVGAQIACYGHTHVANVKQFAGQLIINPGSIRLPRDRVEKTYCIMEWENRDCIYINFYTVDGKKIEDLSYQANLN